MVILDYQIPRRVEGRSRVTAWLIYGGAGIFVLITLIAFCTPRFGSVPGEAQKSAAKIDMAEIQAALEAFRADTGRYPTQSEGLGALVEPPAGGLTGWKGPYLQERQTINPWARHYGYTSPQRGGGDGRVTLTDSPK